MKRNWYHLKLFLGCSLCFRSVRAWIYLEIDEQSSWGSEIVFLSIELDDCSSISIFGMLVFALLMFPYAC